MTPLIALLRAINVSGKNKLRMPDLKALVEGLGYHRVVTYLQSGNLVFDAEQPDQALAARQIEAEVTRVYGYSVRVLTRDRQVFERLIAGSPFTHGRSEDPARLYVTFLEVAPENQAVNAIKIPAGCADEFELRGREIYLFCPGGYGNSKLSNAFFENKLGLSATTRNWNTVNALVELVSRGSF
jgi:uncharacterized protein (DUF1697 family)